MCAAKRKAKYKVLLVDDHHIVRYGLTQLLNREKSLVVCGEAEDVFSALKLIEKDVPDIAIIDLSLKDGDGLDLIKQIKAKYPSVKILVLSMHEEAIYAERSLRAGAMGYIMKQEMNEKLISAIRHLLEGKIYVGPEMTEKMLHKLLPSHGDDEVFSIDRLSDREFEVFKLIGEGYKIGQVAEKLHISISTAEYHRKHIRNKLGIDSASELAKTAIKWMKYTQ